MLLITGLTEVVYRYIISKAFGVRRPFPPCLTPQTGGLSVCHTAETAETADTLTAPQRGESNAGVEIPMMALPNGLGDSKPTGGHAVVYFVPGQS